MPDALPRPPVILPMSSSSGSRSGFSPPPVLSTDSKVDFGGVDQPQEFLSGSSDDDESPVFSTPENFVSKSVADFSAGPSQSPVSPSVIGRIPAKMDLIGSKRES